MDQEKIIFQVGAVGGDFGGKGTLMDLPLCYFLAKVTGRPAKMIMSYAEELSAANPATPRSSRSRPASKKMAGSGPEN